MDYVCLCPFHGNKYTPSFTISAEDGAYTCWNDSCGATGSLLSMVMKLTNRKPMEAIRFIQKKGGDTQAAYEDAIEKAALEPQTFEEWQPGTIERMHEQFWLSDKAINYMQGRGFDNETLGHFQIGYSEAKDMIAVPVHSPDGICIGIVGRSIEGKQFKNSKGLQRNKTLFNIHRAKRIGSIVIICESSYDAMRIHQAGFPNVVAVLGGSLSPYNISLLDRYFDKIIIMTDYDKKSEHKFRDCHRCKTKHQDDCEGHNPGRDTGLKLAAALHHKDIEWAVFSDTMVYPHGKDATDLFDGEIQLMIHNSIPHIEYIQRSDMV